ncbi:MAG TPA: hypothetical protein VHL79_10960 [Ramlibacter sp.]|jgi:hypothetical protein|nr:hypothetical protein [Ramlibacter sp.]
MFLRQATVTLALFLSCAAADAAPPSHDQLFLQATAQYRAGRYSDAFGRFLHLANQGDPEAARIVVFMHTFGPPLFGSYWDLHATDVEQFTQLAARQAARKDAVFQPSWEAPAERTVRKQTTSTRFKPQR